MGTGQEPPSPALTPAAAPAPSFPRCTIRLCTRGRCSPTPRHPRPREGEGRELRGGGRDEIHPPAPRGVPFPPVWFAKGVCRMALRAAALAVHACLLAALHPGDPNVCSYWESFTAAVKESYAKPHIVASTEPCTGVLGTSQLCLQQRIVYRTEYRQAVRTDYRRRYQCCLGYYESRDVCVREWGEGGVGRQRWCPRAECDERSWGRDCGHRCDCHHGAPCDPLSGVCACPPGFADPLCRQPCPPGTYGQGCRLRCPCHHGAPCNGSTGACLCPLGLAGPLCDVPCPEGTPCDSHCPCQNGGICHPPGSNTCVCPHGWMGDICSTPCPPGRFGPGCQGECRCHNGGRCDPLGGQCQCAPGFTGEQCQERCPVGRYGQDCRESCDCANGGQCFHVDGACLCEAGFQGSRCEEPRCLPGLYGLHCQSRCLCHPQHSLSCHPLLGECSCRPGWAGLFCNESCPPGSFGAGCLQSCLCLNGGTCDGATGRCHCPPGYTSSCHPATGVCLCAAGWTGTHCEEECPPGTFGLQCEQLCRCPQNATCHPVTGACPCAPGRSGPHCEAATPDQPYTIVPTPPLAYSTLGVVVSLVALVALLVAVVAVALCYRHRQKGKENRHLAVAYTAGRTDTSEYVVPDVPPGHAHYYSNPSYHTLSQCTLPAPSAQDRASSLKPQVPGPQLFPGAERPYGPEGNATLPPDWKHLGAPPLGPRGGGHLDRSYSYSYSCSLGKYYGKEHPQEGLGASASSLASENPYATIKDLPPLLAKTPEGSYMEMKAPVQREMSYAEIGLLEEPPAGPEEESIPGGAEGAEPAPAPPSHYDSPKNSHIPSHYDVPPVRHHPPSPPLRRKDR
nr:platelet endothelial aggregation receptor 1 [Anser cygnoides]